MLCSILTIRAWKLSERKKDVGSSAGGGNLRHGHSQMLAERRGVIVAVRNRFEASCDLRMVNENADS